MTLLSPVSPAIVYARDNPRRIVHRTRGRKHGPIVRLVSPSDVGELIKPFVFLDYVNIGRDAAPGFGFHPHSGIATLTLLLEGGFAYEDSTGSKGEMSEGAVEWMQAGGGVWHTGKGFGEVIEGYQLWVALPPELETAAAVSQYLDRESFASSGPARVILGKLDGVASPIRSPSSITYLEVSLAAGQVWRYEPPRGHDVAWVAVHEGRVLAQEPISAGELVVFEEAETPLTFEADGPSSFVLGSAVKHPYDLVLGNYSVHTNDKALLLGEEGIHRIAKVLQRDGKL